MKQCRGCESSSTDRGERQRRVIFKGLYLLHISFISVSSITLSPRSVLVDGDEKDSILTSPIRSTNISPRTISSIEFSFIDDHTKSELLFNLHTAYGEPFENFVKVVIQAIGNS
jgi:hypothetical protein